MKAKVLDLAAVTGGEDELLDAELLAMFPRKRETAIPEMLMVRDSGSEYLIRKDDVARMRKRIEDAARIAAVSCLMGAECICGAMMLARYASPMLMLPIMGASLMVLGVMKAPRT